MTLKRLAVIVCAAIGLTMGSGVVKADSLLTNGSFESYTGGHGAGNSPSQLASSRGSGTGYSNLTGWTIDTGTYAFLMAPGVADTTGSYSPEYGNTFTLWGSHNGGLDTLPNVSPDGGNYLALDGGSSYRGGGISQTLTGLTPGDVYAISFDWAGGQQYGFTGNTTEQVQVTFGTQVQATAVYSNASHGFGSPNGVGTWASDTFDFTATGATEVLNFLAVGTPDGVPPMVLLDGVSGSDVTGGSAAPLPTTTALSGTILGLCGIIGLMRRGKAVAA